MWRFLSLALVGLSVLGCGTSDHTPLKYRIAVIPKGTTHEFWKSVHAGAEQAAKESGLARVIWRGPLHENDREGQINVVQTFIAQGVSGIVLAPLDAQALIGPVRDAQSSDIPTVLFDSGLDDPGAFVSYVATDNYQGGALAARGLAAALGGRGNVALLRYNPGSESTEQRERGFLDTLAKDFKGIRVISSEKYLGTTPEQATTNSEQLLLSIGKELDGVFTVCEPNSTGMLRALETAGLAGKMKFIAFDPTPRLIDAMKTGEVSGIVLQDPVRMGYLAVKAMIEHLEGRQVEKRVNTGEFMATAKNMDSPEMRKLLNPVQF